MDPYHFMENPPRDWLSFGKSLYGIEDAPKIWYERLTEELKEIGFQILSNEPCIFRRDYVRLLM